MKSSDAASTTAVKAEIKPPTATQVAMKVFKEKGFFGFYKGYGLLFEFLNPFIYFLYFK